MILDNEDQRKLLLEIINAVPIQGDYAGIKQAILKIDALMVAIRRADVAEVTNAESKSE